MSDDRKRYVHLIVHHDGAPASKQWRLSVAAYRAVIGLGVVSLLALLAGLFFLGPIARAAGRVPGLERQVENLTLENARIADLARAIDSLQLAYERVRGMVGGDMVPTLAEVASNRLPVAPGVDARTPSARSLPTGATEPRYWPLRDAGFITRGLSEGAGGDEQHPGVDVAVAMNTPIRAAGGGRVAQTGEDAEYGRFVRITHTNGFDSMYGHLQRVLVTNGAAVDAGQVIGLSGNSGRSTAPHLHFEIHKEGKNVDPLVQITEGR